MSSALNTRITGEVQTRTGTRPPHDSRRQLLFPPFASADSWVRQRPTRCCTSPFQDLTGPARDTVINPSLSSWKRAKWTSRRDSLSVSTVGVTPARLRTVFQWTTGRTLLSRYVLADCTRTTQFHPMCVSPDVREVLVYQQQRCKGTMRWEEPVSK